VYVDALVLRDRDTDGNGTLDERLYPLQDANWNVTALVSASGTVVERYSYDPYGQVTVRDASGDAIAGSARDWVFLHQGGEQIAAGDYEFRNRAYSPSLGRWLNNDPLGFEAGDNNWYRYEGNDPGNRVDPEGLIWWPGKYLYQMYQEYDRGHKLDSQINNLPINLNKPAVATTSHWINNLNSAIISGVWDGAIMTIDGMSFGLVISDSLTDSLYKEHGNCSFYAGNVAGGALTLAGGVWIYQSYTGSTLLIESKYLTGNSGGIFQIRPDGKAPWFRLDFHPLRGGGKPIIHIDSPPLNWHHWPWK
jgi:RHS repeat-associated protein